jgi:hypothetical protein
MYRSLSNNKRIVLAVLAVICLLAGVVSSSEITRDRQLTTAVDVANRPLSTDGPPDPRPGATVPVREQNVDMDGWIAVHEQGTAAVDVTNSSLTVTGTVDVGNFPDEQDVHVTNFPATQDVNVVGGSLTAQPVTAVYKQTFSLGAGGADTVAFGPIDATTVILSKVPGTESLVTLFSPLVPWSHPTDSVWSLSDPDGNHSLVVNAFQHPIPLDGVFVSCLNESEDCHIKVTVFGF